MKKSRNIKNLRDFPQNGMNCCLDNDLNQKNPLKFSKSLNLNNNFPVRGLTLCCYPVSFALQFIQRTQISLR